MLAVTIGVRAANFVAKELKILLTKRILWTDSTCVLHWLKTNKPLPLFVENRVTEIKRETDITFRYVPSDQNPADFPTRGLSVSEISKARLWWHGPFWLEKPERLWPEWCLPQITPETIKQIQNDNPTVFYEMASLVDNSLSYNDQERRFVLGINETQYSSLRKLLRITVYCFKFIRCFIWLSLSSTLKKVIGEKHRLLKYVFDSVSDGVSIHAKDIKLVSIVWVYYVQQRKFSDVVTAINMKRKHCLIHQLGLKFDDIGILRCYGRLLNAEIEESLKYPKLLPRGEHFTQLLIKEIHERLVHAGVAHTLAQVREEYWIPKGRIEIRSVLSQCFVCRKYEGASFQLPNMPPWPKERVARSNPFQFVGLDYLGPLYVKGNHEMKKIWVCLFTCLTVRAVHLEWVTDLTAVQFLNCMRRFVSHRGKPDLIISDNAPQFKLVNTILNKQWREMLNDKEVLNYVAMEGIRWNYTTALAPWQGGFYERLIGMIKRSLRKAVGKKHFTLEQLITLLTEIEAVLNSRPLTYVYEDLESGFTLTPAHFLVANRKLGLPSGDDDYSNSDGDFQLNKDSGSKLLDSWRKGQIYLDTFWKVWKNEYLLSLRERNPLHHKCSFESPRIPKKGEVVLIKDDNLPRSSWRMGILLNLIQGLDGRVRSAEVLLPGKKIISRAINCLYPLELPTCGKETEDNILETSTQNQGVKDQIDIKQKQNSSNSQQVNHQESVDDDRQPRKALVRARQGIFECLRDNATTILFCFPWECCGFD